MLALLLAVLAGVVAAAVVLVVVVVRTTRALVRPGGRRWAAGLGLAAALVAIAAGLSLTMAGLSTLSDSACYEVAHGRGGPAEGDSWTQGAGLWPPGLRCTFHHRSGEVTTASAGWGPVAFSVVLSASFGGAMALVARSSVRRRFGSSVGT